MQDLNLPITNGLVLLFCLCVATGCATEFYSHSNQSYNQTTGELIITYSDVVDEAAIFIDGRLATKVIGTKRIVLSDIPAGKHLIEATGYHTEQIAKIYRSDSIVVKPGQTQFLEVQVPLETTIYYSQQSVE